MLIATVIIVGAILTTIVDYLLGVQILPYWVMFLHNVAYMLYGATIVWVAWR